jgi:hypothetical protein
MNISWMMPRACDGMGVTPDRRRIAAAPVENHASLGAGGDDRPEENIGEHEPNGDQRDDGAGLAILCDRLIRKT